MIVRPENAQDLAAKFSAAAQRGEKVTNVDCSLLNQLIEHVPEDMTATVQSGMRFADFQTSIGKFRQWLPIEVANEKATLLDVVADNLSGPRRYGYGTVRDYLIGIQAVLGNGQIIRAGGKVVKNVAGYDLPKLFIGSGITLGVVVEATFKLRPLPEKEVILATQLDDLAQAAALLDQINNSTMQPVVVDLHNLSGKLELIAGFAGSLEDVDAQVNTLSGFGRFHASTLEYEARFFSGNAGPVHKISVLPSELTKRLKDYVSAAFVARAGNGIIFTRLPAPMRSLQTPQMIERLKNVYDPSAVLPKLT